MKNEEKKEMVENVENIVNKAGPFMDVVTSLHPISSIIWRIAKPIIIAGLGALASIFSTSEDQRLALKNTLLGQSNVIVEQVEVADNGN